MCGCDRLQNSKMGRIKNTQACTIAVKADRGEEIPWYSWRIQIGNFPRKLTFYKYQRSNSPCCWVVFPQVKSALTASKYLHWRDPNFARRWHSYLVQNAVCFNVLQWTTLPLLDVRFTVRVCVRVGKVCLCLCALCAITLSLSSLFSPAVKILPSSPVEC